PFAIDIYHVTGEYVRHNVFMDQRKLVFSFEIAEKPLLVNVDADKVLLALKNDNKSEEEFIFQFHNAKNFLDRFEALNALQRRPGDAANKVFKAALNDPHWSLRSWALSVVDPANDDEL